MTGDRRLEPNTPRRERGVRRVDLILAAAEEVILTDGIENFSSPKVAQAAGVPTSSVYQFFPTPVALLNALSDRHAAEIERLTLGAAHPKRVPPPGYRFEDFLRETATIVRDYYVRAPVAAELFLKYSDLPRESENAIYTRRIAAGTLMRRWHDRLSAVPAAPHDGPRETDPFVFATGLLDGLMSAALREDGEIGDIWIDAAVTAAILYLRSPGRPGTA